MSGLIIALVIVAIVVVAAGAWVLLERQRRRSLQDRFGGEYDRTVDEAGDRRAAERELVRRQERHEQLDITPLRPERREQYLAQWEAAQARFVDQPAAALGDADSILERLMAERGYPVGDFERRAADLSVEHADVLDHYRTAHAIEQRSRDNQATTEQLREAMVRYRRLFESLLVSDREPHETR